MQVDKTECSHPKTVELYFGIFKCSTCGKLWDEATDEQKAYRATSESNAQRREAKVSYYKRGKKGRRQ